MSATKQKTPKAKRGVHVVPTKKVLAVSPPRQDERAEQAFGRLLTATDDTLMRMTLKGLDIFVIVSLIQKLSVSIPEFANYIGISRATLDRKIRGHKPLDMIQSDRLMRYTHLWKLAVHLWGNEEAAQQWLTMPEPSLSGVSPLEHAKTEIGARQVEDLMGQIAHGIVS